ncbi:MAG: hypothetical protein ABR538_14570 [Candidatus Binatia bacterium]
MHARAAGWLVILLAIPAYAAETSSGSAPPAASEIDRGQQLGAYMLAASAVLGVEQIGALSKITDEHRRNLAMTYYLRAGDSVTSRWSWTTEQIEAYQQSPEHSAAIAEIETIAVHFSLHNPEQVLRANPRIRSLEEQLVLWETVSSVGEAATELREEALETLTREAYGKDPDSVSIKRFHAFLHTWRASRWPTVMAPGLSLHGQGRAYDFQILDKDGRTVADTDTARSGPVWDEQGWTERVSHAVHAASGKFVGPLLKPYEPWHYEYQADRTSRPRDLRP